MRSLIPLLTLVLAFALPAGAQEIDLTLTLDADTSPPTTRVLHFGLDPCATSGLDETAPCDLEGELPPLPPSEVFDARWVDTGSGAVNFGNGSATDYRNGGVGHTGEEVYVLRYQPAGATQVTFSWNLLPGATGTLDAIGAATPFSQPLSGTGSVVWPVDPFVTFFRVSILYGNVLPVELTAFTAVADEGGVLLQWETASETNNAGFEVEARTAAEAGQEAAWQALGFVAGYGTTAAMQQYAYRVADLAPGTHRFRLRQVDYDGTFAYSPEVEVAVGVPGTHRLSDVYPNPFNPRATFGLAVSQSQHVRIAVFDGLGRRVAVLHDGRMEAGASQRFAFDGVRLPSATYLLRVEGETFRETRTLVLAK